MYSVQRGATRYADAPTRGLVQFYSPLLSIPVQFSTIRCTEASSRANQVHCPEELKK